MGAIVSFNYAQWTARYPQFATVQEPTAQLYFNEATIYWRNDGSGPESNPALQSMFLNMLTAHVAELAARRANRNGLVGRVSSATQGSVSVQTENSYPPGTPQWFQQTPFGSDFWAGTAAYRTARYRAPPRRIFTPRPPYL